MLKTYYLKTLFILLLLVTSLTLSFCGRKSIFQETNCDINSVKFEDSVFASVPYLQNEKEVFRFIVFESGTRQVSALSFRKSDSNDAWRGYLVQYLDTSSYKPKNLLPRLVSSDGWQEDWTLIRKSLKEFKPQSELRKKWKSSEGFDKSIIHGNSYFFEDRQKLVCRQFAYFNPREYLAFYDLNSEGLTSVVACIELLQKYVGK